VYAFVLMRTEPVPVPQESAAHTGGPRSATDGRQCVAVVIGILVMGAEKCGNGRKVSCRGAYLCVSRYRSCRV
jgi:hypothetical protein